MGCWPHHSRPDHTQGEPAIAKSHLSRIAAVAGALVLLCALVVLGYVVAPAIFGGAGADSRTATLANISTEMNTDLPARVDAGTRLDSTEAHGETLQYNYTLLAPMAERVDPQTFASEYGPRIRQAMCAKKHLRRLLTRKFKLLYRYRFEDGTPVGEVTVTRADCRA
ncbi:hypothetical protein [Salinisphaera sp. T31B1]|uniref:hypothetical protein n=1 Tax=Salinisphaera sp. T31B1 TaxID=727963 RepID=UPI003342CB2A